MGQALGSALQAGQQGYERAQSGAFNQLLLEQKIKEMQQETAGNEAWRKLLAPQDQPPVLTPSQAALAAPMSVAGPVGPTMARADLAAQMPVPTAAPGASGVFGSLNPEQRAIISGMPRKEGMPEVLKIAAAQADFGKPEPMVVNGQVKMMQFNKLGQSKEYTGATPYEAQSPDIRAVEYISGKPLAGTGQEGIGQVGQYRQQIATRVDVKPVLDMTGGQAGFTNEMALSSKFKAEPIYKDFSDMKSSYGQVISALGQGTPIGDVAGATKVMKLLDPGSVVRESELGIAMAAAGRMDRLQNYFNNMMTGQKLTPQQRDDFKALSNELYAAAGDAYNKKRDEYKEFGSAYGFKNLNTALGTPASVPSIMRGGAGAARPSLGNIFGTPGGR
jgi:hypothetical protein